MVVTIYRYAGEMLTRPSVTLNEKYEKSDGRIFLSGVQALVRLPMVQRSRDRAAGLNTGGFISGYRGSPLGGLDLELEKQRPLLEENDIHFQPGLNEDLAATSIWGTQQLHLYPGAEKDGVFSIWYGKGPGVDRSMDALRHGAAAGSAPLGGVLCIAGDDHGAKSSSLPHQTDHNFMTAFMPLLYPSGHHEFVEFGLLGIAMSRYSGCWVGFKALSETVETSGTVDLSREYRDIIIPTDFEMPPDGLNLRWPDKPRDQDYRLQRYKGFAALAFARANKIDRVVWDSPNPRFGIMTSGKSYQDVRQALYELGIDEERAAHIGLRLYKVGMPWPLEPEGARAFCEGLDEVLVIEEKREMIEHQLKWQLFNWREEVRPTVVGKHDEKDRWLLPPENDLSVGLIAHVIAQRISKFHQTKDITDKLDFFKSRELKIANFTAPITRDPYYCSGCPHNTSTKVPEDSRAIAGIGCHYMVTDMNRNTSTFTQMGGEGVPWIGQAPFTEEKHIFANLGDGTYQHSGTLAIRAAIAAGVNITYKILFNDAVAMTGGQAVEGGLTVWQIYKQLRAEGVEEIAIISENPEALRRANERPFGVRVHPRDQLDTIQRRLRERSGCTVIIYDQTCAAEKRRRRKRGLMDDPPLRAFINTDVCEGCGDCSVQSNCLSVEPIETEFGRKRQINQSTCNKDFSCVEGFCPSFVTVVGGELVKSSVSPPASTAAFASLPRPKIPTLSDQYNILVTGVGGTGVLTISAILGMAAHLDGKASLVADMTGLAQKGGAVYSHIRVGDDPDTLRSSRIITGGADLLLACDKIVATSPSALDILNKYRTSAVVNTHLSPVAGFVKDNAIDFQDAATREQIERTTKKGQTYFVPATEYATGLLGDAIGTNLFVVGYALQKGLIPISIEAVEEAIKLNGIKTEENLSILTWGRYCAHDEETLQTHLPPPKQTHISQSLDEVIDARVEHLTAYQDKALADKYHALVSQVRRAEQRVTPGTEEITRTVALNYAKVLAVKDEYEVARLYTNGTFKENLAGTFEKRSSIRVHLAPPLLNFIKDGKGRPKKFAFGPWVFPLFRILASLKKYRNTRFDPFARTQERKAELALANTYENDIQHLIKCLNADNLKHALSLASYPEQIRGFGEIKMKSLEHALKLRPQFLRQLKTTETKNEKKKTPMGETV